MNINLSTLAQRSAPIRIGCFILALLVLWLPIAAPIYLLLRDDANLATILTMAPLAILFFILLPLWGKYVYQQPGIYRRYGVEFTRKNGVDLLSGLAVGLISLELLFIVQGWLGWLEWQNSSTFLLRFVLEGLISALGVAIAEELFFRGWILDELERDYSKRVALWGVAILFATSHFIKPIAEVIRTSGQFFGLLLLGLTCVWGKRWRQGRLGLPIGLHAGLIWGWYIINVGQLIKYTGRVPEWVTGVNNNPLAGVIGLLFLGVLAWEFLALVVISEGE